MEHLHLEGMKRREAGVFRDMGFFHTGGTRRAGFSALPQDFTSAAIRRDSQYAFYGHGGTQYPVGRVQEYAECVGGGVLGGVP